MSADAPDAPRVEGDDEPDLMTRPLPGRADTARGIAAYVCVQSSPEVPPNLVSGHVGTAGVLVEAAGGTSAAVMIAMKGEGEARAYVNALTALQFASELARAANEVLAALRGTSEAEA